MTKNRVNRDVKKKKNNSESDFFAVSPTPSRGEPNIYTHLSPYAHIRLHNITSILFGEVFRQ